MFGRSANEVICALAMESGEGVQRISAEESAMICKLLPQHPMQSDEQLSFRSWGYANPLVLEGNGAVSWNDRYQSYLSVA
jgi:hypothetical protein